MNIKKLIIATLAAFVVMQVVGLLWHLVLIGDWHIANTYLAPKEPRLPELVFLGVFVLAMMMSYVYPKGYSGGSPVTEGLKFGAIIGIIWVLPHSLIQHGTWVVMSTEMLVVDGLWHIVEQATGGLVIGLIYGKEISLGRENAKVHVPSPAV